MVKSQLAETVMVSVEPAIAWSNEGDTPTRKPSIIYQGFI